MAPDSPTGVDSHEEAPAALDDDVAPQDNSTTSATQPSSSSRSVRISKIAATRTPIGGVPQGTVISSGNAARQPILLSSARHSSTTKDPNGNNVDTPTEELPQEIYDRDQKLYQVFSDDGLKETAYHVTDFAGFYPVWPIVIFSMAPTGVSKDKRMVSFIRCALYWVRCCTLTTRQ